MTSLPQVLVNVRVRKKADLQDIAPIKKVIDVVEAELGDKGRVLIRYSGTEPLLRIMLEGECQDRIARFLPDQIADSVREQIGA